METTFRGWLLLLTPALLVGCATTPSGPPPPSSVFFRGATSAYVAPRLGVACATGGGRLVSDTVNLVECTMPMSNSFKEDLYRALVVEQRGASNPDFHFQWTLVDMPNGVQATAHTWIEHQNAFGKTTRDDVGPGMAGRIIEAAANAWNSNHTQSAVAASPERAPTMGNTQPASQESNGSPNNPMPQESQGTSEQELRSAQSVAAKQSCSDVKPYGTGYKATCSTFDLIIECVAGSCQPVHTQRRANP